MNEETVSHLDGGEATTGTVFVQNQDENSSLTSESSSDDNSTGGRWNIESQEINGAVLPSASVQYGDINIENSSEVHLGSKIIYNGAVVINQIINANSVFVNENEVIPLDCKQKQDSSEINNPKRSKKLKNREIFRPKVIIGAICIVTVILIVLTFLIVRNKSFAGHQPEKAPPKPQNSTTTTTTLPPTSSTTVSTTTPAYEKIELNLVTRAEWNASAPKSPPEIMVTWVPYIFLGHLDSETCRDKLSCIDVVQRVQWKSQFRGEDDVVWNFMVAEDGNIYEGRGWSVVGQHTRNYDRRSYGIGFLGNWEYLIPKREMLDAAKKLIKYAYFEKKVLPDYKLLGQKQVLNDTNSPGDKVYREIVTWDHWSESP